MKSETYLTLMDEHSQKLLPLAGIWQDNEYSIPDAEEAAKKTDTIVVRVTMTKIEEL